MCYPLSVPRFSFPSSFREASKCGGLKFDTSGGESKVGHSPFVGGTWIMVAEMNVRPGGFAEHYMCISLP